MSDDPNPPIEGQSSQNQIEKPKQNNVYLPLKEIIKCINRMEYQVYKEIFSIKQGQPQQIIKAESQIFFIFGLAQAGKTIAQYYLCEDKLLLGQQTDKNIFFLFPQNQYQNALVNKLPTSITTRIFNIRSRYQNGKNIIFVQVPDINKLNFQQKTAQYLFLTEILQKFSQIHILLVVAQQDMEEVDDIIQEVQSVTSYFNLSNESVKQKLSDHISLIVNKFSPEDEEDQFKEVLLTEFIQLIAQENVQIAYIMEKIIKSERIYFIKTEQPSQEQQSELFKKVISQSKFTNFKDIQIQDEELLSTKQVQKHIDQLINNKSIEQIWRSSIKKFLILTKYLIDQKSRDQNYQLVCSMIKNLNKWEQLHFQIPDQNSLNVKQKIPSLFSRSIENCLNLITKIDLKNTAVNIFQAIQKQFHQIKSLSYQLLGIQKQNNQTTQQTSNKKESKQSNDPSIQFYLKFIINICNQFLLTINYITKILQRNLNAEQQLSKSKDSIKYLKNQLLQYFKQEINIIGMNIFKKKKSDKLNKKSKITNQKSIKMSKTSIKQVNATLYDLKKYFISSLGKKNILNQIVNLPNNSFKLLLLLQEYKNDKDLINFVQTTQVIKEICRILNSHKLFLEEIVFLMKIPDWNRIEQVLNRIYNQVKSYNKPSQTNQQSTALPVQQSSQSNKQKKQAQVNIMKLQYQQKELNILISLQEQCQKKNRRKLKGKIEEIVSILLKVLKPENLENNIKNDNLPDFNLLLDELIQNQPQNSQFMYPIIVEKSLSKEKAFSTQLNLINQFQFLTGHKL